MAPDATRRRGRPRGSPGGSRLGLLLFLLTVGAGVYLAVVYVPPYWTYFGLHDVVRVAADTAAIKRDEEKARRDIIEAAKEQGLALTEENIDIFTRETHIVVRVFWSVPVELPRYRHTLRFSIERSSPLP
jgi:hypothetical protein